MTSELLVHWKSLREDRKIPSIGTLDTEILKVKWPRTALLHCMAAGDSWRFDILWSHVWSVADGVHLSDDDYLVVSEWLMSLAEAAIEGEEPISGLEVFHDDDQEVRYRGLALPFAGSEGIAEFVLCEVSRAD